MEIVNLTIDSRKIEARKGATVLEAAHSANIYIPTLCAHPALSAFGACRLCIVEIDRMQGFPTACTTLAAEGMIVRTRTARLQNLRRNILELTLSEHPYSCLTYPESLHCELQRVAYYIGLDKVSLPYIHGELPVHQEDPLIVRDYNLCILCGRCIRACQEMRGIKAIAFVLRGNQTIVGTAFDRPLKDSGCKFCCACVEVCPTGALRDKDVRWSSQSEKESVLVPCTSACPAGIDVPRYVALIATGKFAEALAVIREKVPFPAVLGRVCIHPCEEPCRRGQVNEPIAIRALKCFAAEHDDRLWKQNRKVAPATGKQVAVVGSGPAGLTAAYYLTKLGHKVTVFESLPKPGGMMRVGIPEYRLPREILQAEIAEIESIGVEIRINTRIESLERLFAHGYHAVFLALGAHKGIEMGIEGEEGAGVMDCVSFLRDVSLGKGMRLKGRVVVVGGGNAAIDAARTALRVGADEVTIVYRRTRAEMPANLDEIEGAIEEGVRIDFLVAPAKISRKKGKIMMECIRMKLGEPDASGRRRPEPIKGSEFSMEFSTAIVAIGQRPDIPPEFGAPIRKDNTIEVNPDTLMTDREGVFAGGDVVTGPSVVIEAIAAGRRAAKSIDKYLGGNGIIDESLVDTQGLLNPCLGPDENFAHMCRIKTPNLPVEQRLKGFSGIEMGLDKEAAIEEARRCLQCHLRLQIPLAWLPPIDVSTT